MIKAELNKQIREHFEKPTDRFINRELSWLQFNRRVLEEAENKNNPLLERVRFLSISAGNLNEFYMVRIAGLYDQVEHGIEDLSQDGRTPRQQLRVITKEAVKLRQAQQECWSKLKKELSAEGIQVVKESNLGDSEKRWLEKYFDSNIFPALTPIAVDPAHPFPFLPNLGLAILLDLKRTSNVEKIKKSRKTKDSDDKEKYMRAVIPLPNTLDRFVELPTRKGKKKITKFILLEDVISMFQKNLMADCDVVASGLIRIIRDSELEVTDEAEDLLLTFETAVKQRRRGDVIRLEVNEDMPETIRDFVRSELGVGPKDVEEIQGMLGLHGIEMICSVKRNELKYPTHNIRFPERINDYGGDCFAAIKAKDIVVHHPYESFDVVAQFIRQAAADPKVVAIKQTLYRTSNDSPVVKALMEAAEAGKSVTAVVELKARFDEEANIRWGRNLERAGAQVVYGISGFKTHTKITLIVRREEKGLVSYVHYGTGNYNPVTAKIYTDLSFFTSEQSYCRDAAQVFNYLTGYSEPKKFEKISLAPINMRKTLVELIDDEITHAKEGRPANMWAKMNSLVDTEIIDKLYEASQAGVRIELVIRGICCLKPGIKGFSENIHVKSIVGRFLEHARIFCFGAGRRLPHPDSKLYISSADWMYRNLSRRVELMVPIENSTVHEQIQDQILVANLKDGKQSWIMQPDGSYKRMEFNQDSFSAHEYFVNNPSLSGRGKALHKKKNKPKPLSQK